MSNTQSMTAGAIFDYVDRLEAENRALKEQHEHKVDASEYRNTPISFAEAARILGIKTETLEGYVEQGLIKRMICEARVGKIEPSRKSVRHTDDSRREESIAPVVSRNNNRSQAWTS